MISLGCFLLTILLDIHQQAVRTEIDATDIRPAFTKGLIEIRESATMDASNMLTPIPNTDR